VMDPCARSQYPKPSVRKPAPASPALSTVNFSAAGPPLVREAARVPPEDVLERFFAMVRIC